MCDHGALRVELRSVSHECRRRESCNTEGMRRPLVLAAVLLLVSACSPFGEAPRDDSDLANPAVDGLTTTPRSAPNAAPAPPNTTTTSTTAPTANAPASTLQAACKDAPTRDSCNACCTDPGMNAMAQQGAIDKAWTTCACNFSRCGAACADDVCTHGNRYAPMSSACEECLDRKVSTCDDAEDADLTKPAVYDPPACVAASECNSKPGG